MELDSLLKQPYGPTVTAVEYSTSDQPEKSGPLDLYSLVPYPSDLLSRAESRKCFKTDETRVQVTWMDVDTQGQVAVRTLRSLAELRRCRSLYCPQTSGLRILSVNQSYSWGRLNVTHDMFQEIVGITGASSDLLELPLSFFGKNIEVEDAFSSAPFFRSNADSIEIAYIMKYVCEKPVEEKEKDHWVLRQTGVYQKYDIATKNSTWMFLHPRAGCEFQKRLTDFLQSADQWATWQRNPLIIHSILFGTFFPPWRDYLANYESKMLLIGNTAVACGIDEKLRVDHRSLTAVRTTENRCLTLQPIFRCLDKTFEALHQMNGLVSDCGAVDQSEVHAMRQLLNNYSSMLNSYTQAAWSLQSRAARIASHITDTLSFRDAFIAKKQSDYMLRDSTTVRVITVVTLIYLPSTFMATLLGMNSFFEMDADNHHLVVSPQFWIYVACSVPLTAATLLYWWFFQRAKKREGHADNEAMMV